MGPEAGAIGRSKQSLEGLGNAVWVSSLAFEGGFLGVGLGVCTGVRAGLLQEAQCSVRILVDSGVGKELSRLGHWLIWGQGKEEKTMTGT
jgi:hypothetical protein